ncbi:MAG TPA: hypothetical protein VK858_11500 [Longimicrobiales bacterium]|nr:hypothetical protein [Longimicrobiales bacterium]
MELPTPPWSGGFFTCVRTPDEMAVVERMAEWMADLVAALAQAM